MISRGPRSAQPQAPCGKRRNATIPTTETAAVLTSCASTIAAIVSEMPNRPRSRPRPGGGPSRRLVQRRGSRSGRAAAWRSWRRSRATARAAAPAAIRNGTVRPLVPKIAVGDRRERQHRHRREHAADQLQLECAAEEPAQAAPLPCARVTEAVLRQRLLHGQVEQRLEEPCGRQHGRVEAELVQGERSRRDDRRQDAERQAGVEADCGGDPPPMQPAHGATVATTWKFAINEPGTGSRSCLDGRRVRRRPDSSSQTGGFASGVRRSAIST